MKETAYCDVHIAGPITEHSAAYLNEQLYAIGNAAPVRVIIDSDGGQVAAAVKLYDTLRGRQAPVRARINKAHSAAMIPAMAADYREIRADATMLLHAPALSNSRCLYTIDAMLLNDTRFEICRLIADATGLEITGLQKLMSTGAMLSAARCVALGLADEIIRPSVAVAKPRTGSSYRFNGYGATRYSSMVLPLCTR